MDLKKKNIGTGTVRGGTLDMHEPPVFTSRRLAVNLNTEEPLLLAVFIVRSGNSLTRKQSQETEEQSVTL